MTSALELLKLLNTIGESIQRIIRNYKKDSGDTKTKASFYYERYRNLSNEWNTFDSTDDKLRILDRDQSNIDYFENQYYKQIQVLT